eukprot:1121245-Prymnesium_polylepis.1
MDLAKLNAPKPNPAAASSSSATSSASAGTTAAPPATDSSGAGKVADDGASARVNENRCASNPQSAS